MQTVLLDGDSLGLQDLALHDLQQLAPGLRIYAHTAPEQTAERIRHARIVISNKVLLTRELMFASPALKLIVIAATGSNNVDLVAAAERGITVCNAQNYATESVAQHALALLLMLATQAPFYINDVRAGAWSAHDQFCLLHRPIVQLRGRVLGVVGAGNSGNRLAELARALGMTVRFAQLPDRPESANKVPLATLLPECDALSLHCPLTAQTRHLVNDHLLSQLKRGAFLLNIARGALVDNDALARALRSGQLGGAALDVLDTEPPPPDHPLLDPALPNLLITPHNAWASRETRQQLLTQIGENIAAFNAGAPIRCL